MGVIEYSRSAQRGSGNESSACANSNELMAVQRQAAVDEVSGMSSNSNSSGLAGSALPRFLTQPLLMLLGIALVTPGGRALSQGCAQPSLEGCPLEIGQRAAAI